MVDVTRPYFIAATGPYTGPDKTRFNFFVYRNLDISVETDVAIMRVFVLFSAVLSAIFVSFFFTYQYNL